MQAVGTGYPVRVRGLVPVVGFVAGSVLIGAAVARLGPAALLPVFGVLLISVVMARPEYGIALFLSTFLMSYPRWMQGSGYLTINNALGGIFLLLLTYRVYRDQDWWFLKSREMQILGFIILIFYLSARFNSPDPHKVELLGAGFYFAEGLRTFINRVAFVLFLIVFIRTPAHLRMLVLLALFFMVFTALTGVQGVLRGGGLKGYRAFTEVSDLVAGQAGLIRSAGNPNRLAMFSILAIASLWYLMQVVRVPAMRLLIVPTMALLALAVFMTASRSGLLGLLVCTAAITVDGGFNLRKLLSIGLAAALLVVMVVQFVPEKSLERITNLPGTSTADTGEGSASIERRQGAVGLAVDIFRDNPVLGVGMGNWHVVRFLKDPGYAAGSPHNSYLLTLVEGGPFALLAFLVLLWWTWQNLRFAESYVSEPFSPLGELEWIVKSSKVSLLVLVFFSMVADLWNLVVLFMLVGFGVVARRLVEQSMREEAAAA
ncbi:O-antigen ligase family protein [Candidatus Binatia bacterium]|nr:O-antigen ligase family protein [Candidatus Binatia bacterium]